MPDRDPCGRLLLEPVVRCSPGDRGRHRHQPVRGRSIIGDAECAEARQLLERVLRERAGVNGFDTATLIA